MRFSNPDLEGAVNSLLADGRPAEDVAKGQNLRWESRVDDPRRTAYEAELGAATAADIVKAHARFVLKHVNVKRKGLEPACFDEANRPALLPIGEGEALVRVEDLSSCVDLVSGKDPHPFKDPVRLKEACDGRTPGFRGFLRRWNNMADNRPMFAVVRGELDVQVPGWRDAWWIALPELLGLGHLESSPTKPRVVALLEYTAKRVLNHEGAVPPERRFAAPTVIDHTMNPFFCPSPTPARGAAINYGRAVNLCGRGTLVCEVIHRRVPYVVDMVKDVVLLTEKGPWVTVEKMRAAHVAAIRRCQGWAHFGS